MWIKSIAFPGHFYLPSYQLMSFGPGNRGREEQVQDTPSRRLKPLHRGEKIDLVIWLKSE